MNECKIDLIIFIFDTGFSISAFRFDEGYKISISGVAPDIERAFDKSYGSKVFGSINDVKIFISSFTEARVVKELIFWNIKE